MRVYNIWAPVLAGMLAAIPSQAASPPSPQTPAGSIALLSEFRPIGGTGNNVQNPNLNAVPNSPELTLAPLNFAPGTSNGLVDGPNPRTISNVISGEEGANGQNGQTNDSRASAWLYVFGQFIDHDISLEATPQSDDPINITIPAGDPAFQDGETIALNRDVRSPTTDTIINTVTGYLDLSQLYGSDEQTAASLRNADGTLANSSNGQALSVVNDKFAAGDVRVMENPELTAVTMLFMREHNYWVTQLAASNPSWTGDQVYNMARTITTAEYQNIIYNEYLPLLIGPVLPPYAGYNPNVNPQVTQEFSTAAFRVGHSQVSDTQEGLNPDGSTAFVESLGQSFFNTPEEDMSNGIDPLLQSLGADSAQATDVYVVAELRNLLTAGLVGGDVDVIDLIAIDVQRERDVGLGTLNQTRQAIGLSPYTSFAALTPDPVLQANLSSVYGDIDSVDLFIGGLAEPAAPGAIVGPTFQTIIGDQFNALRAGDRFFWLNQGFDPQTAAMISKTKLSDIILRNTTITQEQRNAFIQAPVGAHHIPTHMRPPADVNPNRRPLPPPFTQAQ